MPLHKYSPIILAAGLTLGCDQELPLEGHCQNTMPMLQFGNTGLCADIKSQESKTYCEQLLEQTRNNFMSACMTTLKNTPMECSHKGFRYECKKK